MDPLVTGIACLAIGWAIGARRRAGASASGRHLAEVRRAKEQELRRERTEQLRREIAGRRG
ncbi:hypothetical protein ACFB49_42770 [Sphingomonas sp. DBB INV C78]|uniref:hypothetical protein n=1 Tax=Sphingomonas sp. DBB INV C78 TaxID=3349434 RepID=UPI0036D2123C